MKGKQSRDEKDLECTFRPQINKNSLLIASKSRPIYERVFEINRRRKEKIQAQRLELHRQSDRFTPKISKYSRHLAQSRVRGSGSDSVAAHKRLEYEATVKQQKIAQLRKETAQKEAAECTFAPRLTKGTEFIVAESDHFKGKNRDFITRQKAFAMKRDRELRGIKVDLARECTFTPRVSSRSTYSTGESDVIKRLMDTGKKIKQKQNEHAQQVYSSFTFQPDIDPHSKRIASTARRFRPVTTSTYNSGMQIKMKRDELRRKYEKEVKSMCPFKPSLHQSQRKVRVQSVYSKKDPHSIMARIEESRRKQEAKQIQLEIEKIEKESRGCTFQPNLVASSPILRAETHRDPIVVRGLGKHLERQSLGRKQREEKKKSLENGRFVSSTLNPPKRRGMIPSFTTPKPFKLSVDPRAGERRDTTRAELEQHRYGECSFAPVTNVPSHDILHEILESSDDWDLEQLDSDLLHALV
ncbi:hypothetical protein ADUPG1_008079 [Aduncisulcus paluster]|uniref:Uncharacterized protein n=1 Tax=Aduncisulcus paluster TaxID=2918883 RepID=A0ABQ5KQN1_9EUKA|nr:hypothetical protein ADUPG1_008079 [Aduncisulcus paluster]